MNVITTKTPTGKVVSPASLAFGKACNTSAVVVGPNGQQTAIVKVAPRVSLATASMCIFLGTIDVMLFMVL